MARTKGALNRSTKAVKQLAQEHGPDAIKTLAKLVKSADSDSAKIAACRELLDRAYGKATQPIAGDEENPLRVITEIALRGVRPDERDRASS